MRHKKFIAGVTAELMRQGLAIPPELQDILLDAVDLDSYEPLRALREPAKQVWSLTIFDTPLPASDTLRLHYGEALWSWSQTDVLDLMVELSDLHRVMPTAVDVDDDTVTLKQGAFTVLRVAPINFVEPSPRMLSRYEKLFDGLMPGDALGAQKRLQSLPGFRRFAPLTMGDHVTHNRPLLQPTIPGIAQWLKAFIEAQGGTIALHSAQELLARLIGFSDWQQLKGAEMKNVAPSPKATFGRDGALLGWHRTAGSALWHLDQLITTIPTEDVEVRVVFSSSTGLSVYVHTDVSQHPDWRNPPPIIFCMVSVEEASCNIHRLFSEALTENGLDLSNEERQALLAEGFGLSDPLAVRLSKSDSRLQRTHALMLGPYRLTRHRVAYEESTTFSERLNIERLTAAGEHDMTLRPIPNKWGPDNLWPVTVAPYKCNIRKAAAGGYELLSDYGRKPAVYFHDLDESQIKALMEFARIRPLVPFH